jgi:hypothetical protein
VADHCHLGAVHSQGHPLPGKLEADVELSVGQAGQPLRVDRPLHLDRSPGRRGERRWAGRAAATGCQPGQLGDGEPGRQGLQPCPVQQHVQDDGAAELMAANAERNRVIPGLVRLYATLATDALQENYPESTEFITARFRQLREDLADPVRQEQEPGSIASDIDLVDAAVIIAASDGLQVQWLLAPETVDVHRSLTLLKRLLPGSPGPVA